MKARRIALGLLLAFALIVAGVIGLAWWREALLESSLPPRAGATTAAAPEAQANQAEAVSSRLIERGAYLARIANCAGCHTARGGPAYAGGVALGTPFGTLYTSNLTPDDDTGLGRWTAQDFWAAMHHGRSRDGRLLYPAFPYTSYSQMTRADAGALFAYLRSLPAVRQAAPAHQLGWPYRSQTALALWRLAYFDPVEPPLTEPATAPERGRYLAQAVAHCAECHAPRNRLGALNDAPALQGGRVGAQDWWAPSLADPRQAGVQDWTPAQVSAWLRSGWSERGAAVGPMADVVSESLQHLSEADAQALASYLHALPKVSAEPPAFKPAPLAQRDLGREVYAQHCASCHGEQGQGRRSDDGQPAYPPLAGNRAVVLEPALNVLQVIANGAYAPATPGHPRPYGMPPMRQILNPAEIAAVATHVRQSWGNQGSTVTEQQALRLK